MTVPFPFELQEKILLNVDPTTLVHVCSLVCRTWKERLHSSTFWKRLMETQKQLNFPPGVVRQIHTLTWKEAAKLAVKKPFGRNLVEDLVRSGKDQECILQDCFRRRLREKIGQVGLQGVAEWSAANIKNHDYRISVIHSIESVNTGYLYFHGYEKNHHLQSFEIDLEELGLSNLVTMTKLQLVYTAKVRFERLQQNDGGPRPEIYLGIAPLVGNSARSNLIYRKTYV